MIKNKLSKSFILIAALFLMGLSCIPSSTVKAQEINPVKARKLFIEHFMKYILWPKEDYQKDFVISVFKDDAIYKELKNAFEAKDFRGRKVLVKKVTNPNELKGSAMVYLPPLETEATSIIISVIENSNALVITNVYEEGKKGSAINFREKNGDLSFELDLAAANKSHLKVSTQLKQLATLL